MEINTKDFDALLEAAVKYSATDIHLTAGSPPAFRVNSELGILKSCPAIMPEDTFKIAKSLLCDNKFSVLERDGEIDFSFSKSGLGRFRVNIYRQRGTYSIAIRSLPFHIPSFESLRLPQSIKGFAKKTKGLVLATGPTGSGKSTTLASLLNVINQERRCHIITIEDPIEYLHRHCNSLVDQREIGSDTKSFAAALRAALREDPDVILVGEMRDPETISIALTAAETGHLVFSTLHTVGAAKTIDRIIDAFEPSQQNQVKSQLATVLEGVVSQQLVPRRDGKGIVLACEVMFVSSAIRNLIREGKPYQINSVIQTSSNAGMQTLEGALAQLVNDGVVSFDDALVRAADAQYFFQLTNKRW